ncbi:MAG: hypothetical protein WC473_03140 [Patescibacteria group bacterium]
MNQSALSQYEQGSAERVIAHAAWKHSRGRQPSMTFILEHNPRKALALAKSVIRCNQQTKLLDRIGAKIVESKTYDNMTDAEIKIAVRSIISSSSSEEEVKQRVRDELGCPYGICLSTDVPTDVVGREARELVRGLGGLVMKNGAMAMATIHGHNGVILI